MSYIFKTAVQQNVDAIYQVGDFGFWPNSVEGIEFLSYVSHGASKLRIPLYWHDGNHEQFDALVEENYEVTQEGFWQILPNLFYSPRGHRWTWEDVRFLSLGGAASIDKAWRLEQEAKLGRDRVFWFAEEQITQADIYNCGTLNADIMFTHDTVYNAHPLRNMLDWPELVRPRMALQAIANAVQPWLLMHGHYHVPYEEKVQLDSGGLMQVVGLAHDSYAKKESSWRILTINNGEWELSRWD